MRRRSSFPPNTASSAGSRVTAASMVAATVIALARPSADTNGIPIRNRLSSATITVEPATSTERPAVPTAVWIDSARLVAGEHPLPVPGHDQQRIVDPDAEPDHRRDDRCGGPDRDPRGQQPHDRQAEGEGEQGRHDRHDHGVERAEGEQEHDHGRDQADDLAAAGPGLGRRRRTAELHLRPRVGDLRAPPPGPPRPRWAGCPWRSGRTRPSRSQRCRRRTRCRRGGRET